MSNNIDDPHSYKYPFRTNFELIILVVWFVSGLIVILMPSFLYVPSDIYYFLGGCMIFFSLCIGTEGIEIYIRKQKLKGYDLTFVDPSSDYMLKKFGIKDKRIISEIKKNRKS